MKLSLLFQVQGFFCIVHSKCLALEECGKVWLGQCLELPYVMLSACVCVFNGTRPLQDVYSESCLK